MAGKSLILFGNDNVTISILILSAAANRSLKRITFIVLSSWECTATSRIKSYTFCICIKDALLMSDLF